MLALRTAACNERWDEATQQLRAARHAQRQQRRQQQALQRLRQQVCRTLLQRVAQRAHDSPPPVSLPAISCSPPAKRVPKYSWRQPFLRRPVCAKT